MTDAHLQRTCSEIVHVQPQSCDHTLNHARIDTGIFFNGIMSSATAKC